MQTLRDRREVDVARVRYALRCIQDLESDDITLVVEVQDHARLVLVTLGHGGVLEDDGQGVGSNLGRASFVSSKSCSWTQVTCEGSNGPTRGAQWQQRSCSSLRKLSGTSQEAVCVAATIVGDNGEELATVLVDEPHARTLPIRRVERGKGSLLHYYFTEGRRGVSVIADGVVLRGGLRTKWSGRERRWSIELAPVKIAEHVATRPGKCVPAPAPVSVAPPGPVRAASRELVATASRELVATGHRAGATATLTRPV